MTPADFWLTKARELIVQHGTRNEICDMEIRRKAVEEMHRHMPELMEEIAQPRLEPVQMFGSTVWIDREAA